ncbi:conserved hypothetical protein [Trichinella spiralis]|uniref:hypothetical protein n=1 Tax=Trichinella spiralis TaxID=6334 RepID=UPI0001EFE1EE|nr:conserved hypothetical protein [Trichinella spiralis]
MWIDLEVTAVIDRKDQVETCQVDEHLAYKMEKKALLKKQSAEETKPISAIYDEEAFAASAEPSTFGQFPEWMTDERLPLWNVHNVNVRMNNYLEGWHNRLNRKASKGYNGFYELLQLLIAEQVVMDTLIQQVLSGNVTVGDLRQGIIHPSLTRQDELWCCHWSHDHIGGRSDPGPSRNAIASREQFGDHTDRALGLRDVVLQDQQKSFSWRSSPLLSLHQIQQVFSSVSSAPFDEELLVSGSIAGDHVLMAAIPEHGLRLPGFPHNCGQSAVQLKRGQSAAFVALFSQECQGSGIETGLYLTTCYPEFFFIEQHLTEDLPQRFLYRPDEPFQ